jgi:hypothetical protein
LCYLNIKSVGGLAMAESLKFRVETTDENVIVTLPGTNCMVEYRKSAQAPGLALCRAQDDAKAPIHEIHFLARAWQLAIEKAKELGWLGATATV